MLAMYGFSTLLKKASDIKINKQFEKQSKQETCAKQMEHFRPEAQSSAAQCCSRVASKWPTEPCILLSRNMNQLLYSSLRLK